MPLKPNVYIPIEIMYRELSSRLYLTGHLVSSGFRVYIGTKQGIYNLIKKKKTKEGIFLYKSSFGKNIKSMAPIINNCEHVSVIDEELGIGMGHEASAIERRLVNLEFISNFFVIGNEIKKKIISRLKAHKNKIVATGWPIYDLCKKKNLNLYLKESKDIKKKYKKFLLFSSNFGILNKQDLMKRKKEVRGNKNNKNNKKIINELFSNKYKDYKLFIKKINDYSKKKNIKIIIRPHPGEKKFKNWFEDVSLNKNVKIVYDNDIAPWILASEGLIHRGCSTSSIATLLNKKVFYLLPDRKLKKYEKNITFKISNKIRNFDFRRENINYVKKKDINKILNKNILNYSTKNSEDIIIKHLKKLKVTKTFSYDQYNVFLKINDLFKKIKFSINVFSKKNYNLKMPKIISKKNIFRKLQLIFKDKKFFVKNLGGETFEIDC